MKFWITAYLLLSLSISHLAHSAEVPKILYDLRPVDRITWVCEDPALRLDTTQLIEIQDIAKPLIFEACDKWTHEEYAAARQRAEQAFRIQSTLGFAKMIDFEVRLRMKAATQADSFARSLVKSSRLDKDFSLAWQADHYFERQYYDIGIALTEKIHQGHTDYKLYAELLRAIRSDDPTAESLLESYLVLRAPKNSLELEDVRHQLSALIPLDDSFSAPLDYSKHHYVDTKKIAEEEARTKAEFEKLSPHEKKTRALLEQLSSFEMPMTSKTQ